MPRIYFVCNTLGLHGIKEDGGLLRARTGHDVKDCKERTLVRRMQVLQIIDVPAFIERLRQDPKEVDALLQDLLIGEPADMAGLKPTSARMRLRVNGEDVTPENHPMRLAVTTGKAVRALEAELVRPDGTAIAVMFSATPLFNEAGPAGETLVLQWSERGGRPVNRPAKEDFGLGFLRRSIAYELAGTAEMAFDMTGLQCVIRFPLAGEPQLKDSAT